MKQNLFTGGAVTLARRAVALASGLLLSLAAQGQTLILDPNFTPSVLGDSVNSLAIQNDGKIVVAGVFGAINGQVRGNTARLNPDGSLDSSFNANGNSWGNTARIQTMAIQTNGALFVGGYFGSVDIPGPYNLVRLNNDGTAHEPFAVSGVDVFASALQNDGSLIIGGWFSSVRGLPRFDLARFVPANAITPPRLGSLSLYADGTVETTLADLVAGLGYRVDTSADLVSWTIVTNFMAGSDSLVIKDSPAVGGSRRFYRAVIP